MGMAEASSVTINCFDTARDSNFHHCNTFMAAPSWIEVRRSGRFSETDPAVLQVSFWLSSIIVRGVLVEKAHPRAKELVNVPLRKQ